MQEKTHVVAELQVSRVEADSKSLILAKKLHICDSLITLNGVKFCKTEEAREWRKDTWDSMIIY